MGSDPESSKMGSIHTLFDLELIGIDPDKLEVRVSRKLMDTTYGYLDGVEITRPSDDFKHPSRAALKTRWGEFEKADSANTEKMENFEE